MATQPNHFVSALMLISGLLLTLSLDFTVGGEVGVCYGRNGNNLLPPQQVVDLYKRRNIRRMRIYDPDYAILDALRNSGIELTATIANHCLQNLATSQSYANDWVRYHINNYPDVNFKYIAVGNEISPTSGETSRYARFVYPAMINVYRAVCSCRRGRIKITTSLGMDVMGKSYPPDEGDFVDGVKQFLRPILSFLSYTGSPLMMNIYPYFAYINDPTHINLGYALLVEGYGIHVKGVYYDNLLCAMVDAVNAAVHRVSNDGLLQSAAADYNQTRCYQGKLVIGGRMPPRRGHDALNVTSSLNNRDEKVVTSETGWPTSGHHSAANLRYAQIYNQNLIDRVVGAGLEAYIFALFDENEKPGDETERHFGLFYPDGQPKYDINFN